MWGSDSLSHNTSDSCFHITAQRNTEVDNLGLRYNLIFTLYDTWGLILFRAMNKLLKAVNKDKKNSAVLPLWGQSTTSKMDWKCSCVCVLRAATAWVQVMHCVSPGCGLPHRAVWLSVYRFPVTVLAFSLTQRASRRSLPLHFSLRNVPGQLWVYRGPTSFSITVLEFWAGEVNSPPVMYVYTHVSTWVSTNKALMLPYSNTQSLFTEHF